MLRRIWDWLGDSDNRGRLSIISAAVIGVSGWLVLFYSKVSVFVFGLLYPLPEPPELPSAQTGHSSYVDAQLSLAQRLSRDFGSHRAKNIVLITAEGLGVTTNTFIRIGVGQVETGNSGEDYSLPQDKFDNVALAKTYLADWQTSGNGFGQVFSGVKANVNNIGTQADADRCSNISDNKYMSIAEVMAAMGKTVGLVSNTRVTYSSVAANYANISNRAWETRESLPERCDQLPIAEQLIESVYNGDIDIVFGGGIRTFVPDSRGNTQSEDLQMALHSIREPAGRSVRAFTKASALINLNANRDVAYIGLFSDSHMSFETDRSSEPSLSEMTEAALRILKTNREGFFLNITSGRIDHALHIGALRRAVEEGRALKGAIDKVLSMTDPTETLIILATGHDQSLSMNGYCVRGKPITGLCYAEDGTPSLDADGRPYPIVTMANGPKTFGDITDIRELDFQSSDYIAPAGFRMHSTTHSPSDVAVYATGPWSHLVSGTLEPSMLFHVMYHAVTSGDRRE